MRALVVEDDLDLNAQLHRSLEHHGYAVDTCGNGNDAWFLGETEQYDVVILDLGLPGMDGLSVLGRWREKGLAFPVLILTARDTWREKVTGLRAGADDYLAKPFEMEEMLARIEVLTRRAAGHATAIIRCASLELDPARQRVTEHGRAIEFSALEYRLMAYMINHQNQVISKTTLTEHLYHQDFNKDSNVIEVLINRCRKKLGDHNIRTLRGQGYLLGDKTL
jgi:two-component system, OmpR family, response regulator